MTSAKILWRGAGAVYNGRVAYGELNPQLSAAIQQSLDASQCEEIFDEGWEGYEMDFKDLDYQVARANLIVARTTAAVLKLASWTLFDNGSLALKTVGKMTALEVFDFSNLDFSKVSQIIIDPTSLFPCDDTTYIFSMLGYKYGTQVDLNFTMDCLIPVRSRVIWWFPDATNMKIFQPMQGTILASGSGVTSSATASVSGHVFAKSFVHEGTASFLFENIAFDGCAALPANVDDY